ncbi:MAG: tetratricopeptide repeat protein [Pyrinomonadaceae bacterium]
MNRAYKQRSGFSKSRNEQSLAFPLKAVLLLLFHCYTNKDLISSSIFMRNVKSLFILLLTLMSVSEAVVAQPPQAEKNSDKSASINSKTVNRNGGKNASSKEKLDDAETSVKAIQKPLAKNVDKADAAKAQAAFNELKGITDIAERIEKLNKFIADFPRSELKVKATEMLIVSQVEVGETDFRNGDRVNGAGHFQAAARTFEPSVSDGVFNDFIVKLPFSLFVRGERVAALEVAQEIEPKIKDNAARLIALVNFYLSTENADDAKRLAARAAEVAPDSAAAQISLGMTHRIAFHLEAASQAYARALELDSTSIVAKRNLADAWRGLGQTEEALKLYRELLETNAADEAARNGLILTLFNAGNKDEAEKELVAALEQNPKNLILQTGAAYWYATNGDGRRAVELAQNAVSIEPRYVWGQIALARGLILEKRPLEAERALITARQYGKFPTLDYELANAHFAAGLYDEAADDLHRSFTLKNDKLQTKLAGREQAEAENFIELLSRERSASIFEPRGASNELEARKLKELFALADADANSNGNSAQNNDENGLLKAAQAFAADEDEMRVHRELYAADKLLNRKIALEQVLEMTRNATNGLEKSLDVPAATAAVLAEELYDPRRLAATNGNIINIPNLPREILRQIMRGRVEEIAGWSLYQQNKPEEAVIRLRRAVGVLPANSAWWRSSYWKLGSALEAGGKSKEALDAYIKSYKADVPNETRLVIIQSLYQRLNGSLDGLESRLSQTNASPSLTINQPQTVPRPTPITPASFKNPLPNVIAEILPPKSLGTLKTETQTVVETKPEQTVEKIPLPEANLETKPEPTPEIKAEVAPQAILSPEIKKEIVPQPNPEKEFETKPIPEVVTAQTPDLKSESETSLQLPPEIKTVENVVTETKIEAKVEDKTENNQENKDVDKSGTKPETVAKPLVEPALVPELRETKTDDALVKPAPTAQITIEPTASNENILPEKKADELNANKNNNAASTENVEADSLLSRPRVVIVPLNKLPESAIGQTESQTKTSAACVMQISQPELSILRNGGTAALLVSFGDAADAEKLNISVSSPDDITVVLQPSDEQNNNRRLFQISSTSEVTKIYTITFESPCGKAEVKVKVR